MKGFPRLLFAATALLFALPSAAQDIAFRVTIPPGVVADHVIAPGASVAAGQGGSIAFTLHNDGAVAGMARVGGYFESPPAALAEYGFVATDPQRCPAPELATGLADLVRVEFVVGPIPASASVTCSYAITRRADSRHDLKLRLCGSRAASGFCNAIYRRGTLPDLSLTVEPATVPTLPIAPNQALVRVRLHNGSAIAGASRAVTTECDEFEGGMSGPGPFIADVDFPGACELVFGVGPGCVSFTGQSSMNYAFQLGPAPAHGDSTCLVRLTFPTPAMRAHSVDFYLADDRVERADGGLAFDANSANDATLLGGAVVAGASAAVTIPLPAGTLPLLALLLAAVGATRLRRLGAARD